MTTQVEPPPQTAPDRWQGLRDRAVGMGARIGRGLRRLAGRLPAVQAEDLAAVLAYAGFALVLTFRVWGSDASADNPRDHAQFLFFFEHAAWAITHGHNPLFTTHMGAPTGVNLMANTAFLGMAVPLLPVTLLFGAEVTYGLSLTIGLAGTAAAWYVVLRRHITPHRGVAFAAAALCGFGPGIAGHAVAHPNFVAQFLLPFIVSGVIRLRTATRPVRSGVLLGLMIAYQVFLNEELLFFTALACTMMVIVYALSRPTQALEEAGRVIKGLGVAAGVAIALAAGPLWFQFAGPQHTTGPIYWAGNWYNDVAGLPGYPRNGISGWISAGSYYNNALDETNGFLGLPVLVIALVTTIGLWRLLAVRIAAVIMVVCLALSLGDPIRVKGEETIPGPFHLLKELPLFDTVIVSRFGLIATPAAAILVAVAGDRLLGALRGAVPHGMPDATAAAREAGTRQFMVWGVLAAVLLPVAPMPIRSEPPMSVPEFFTGDAWRQYVDGGTIVPVPPGTASESTLRWILATDLQVRFTDGYFYAPTSEDDPTMRYGHPDRPTRRLLHSVEQSGVVPPISDENRATALADLRFWEADALVLAPQANGDQLRQTVEELLHRPGTYVAGVWVWDVRDLV